MSRRFAFGLLWILLTLVIAGGAAAYAYHLGTLATVAAAGGGGYIVHPYGGYWGWGPGFGFFPFGFLFPLFFILLLVSFLRPRRWYGGPGMYGHHDEHRRQRFEEWHRQAHGEAPAADPRSEPPPHP